MASDKTYKLTLGLSNGETIDAGTFIVPAGEDGSDGAPGEDGATGATGEKGDKGDTGDTGATGADGSDGLSVRIGNITTTVTFDSIASSSCTWANSAAPADGEGFILINAIGPAADDSYVTYLCIGYCESDMLYITYRYNFASAEVSVTDGEWNLEVYTDPEDGSQYFALYFNQNILASLKADTIIPEYTLSTFLNDGKLYTQLESSLNDTVTSTLSVSDFVPTYTLSIDSGNNLLLTSSLDETAESTLDLSTFIPEYNLSFASVQVSGDYTGTFPSITLTKTVNGTTSTIANSALFIASNSGKIDLCVWDLVNNKIPQMSIDLTDTFTTLDYLEDNYLTTKDINNSLTNYALLDSFSLNLSNNSLQLLYNTGTDEGSISLGMASLSTYVNPSAYYATVTDSGAITVSTTNPGTTNYNSLSNYISYNDSKLTIAGTEVEVSGTTYTISENSMTNGIQLVLNGSDSSSSSIYLYPVVKTDGTLSLSASNSSSYSLSNYISYSDNKLTIAGDEVSISGGTASIDTFTANIDELGNITLAVNGVNAYVDISSYVEGIATGDLPLSQYVLKTDFTTQMLESIDILTAEAADDHGYEVSESAAWDVTTDEEGYIDTFIINGAVVSGAVIAESGSLVGIEIASAADSIVTETLVSSLQAFGGTSETLGVGTGYQISSDGSIYTNNIQFADYSNDGSGNVTLVNLETAIVANGGAVQMTGNWASETSLSVTSDRNFKKQIEYSLPDAYEELFDALKPTRYLYTYGSSSRYHVGLIAQDVESAVKNAGLQSTDFAGYTIDNNGRYGLRYDEFIALCIDKIHKLEKRIAVLEQQNNGNPIK